MELSRSTQYQPYHLPETVNLPALDDSEVSHKTGDPLFRRPLSTLSTREKAIRHHAPTVHVRRLGKITFAFLLTLFHRLHMGG